MKPEVGSEETVHEIEVPGPELKEPPEEVEDEEYEEDLSEEDRYLKLHSEISEELAGRVHDDIKLAVEAIEIGYSKMTDDVEKLQKIIKELQERADYLEKGFKKIRKASIRQRIFKLFTSKLWRKPRIKKASTTSKRILYLRHTQDQIKEETSNKFKEYKTETAKKIKEVSTRQAITDELLLDRLDTFERMTVGVKERIRRLEDGDRPIIRGVRVPKKKRSSKGGE